MNLSKGERLFLLFLLLLTAAAGVFLWFDFNRRLDAGDAEIVGRLVIKRNTAERRYSAQVVWESLGNSFPLYNKDTIRTGTDSEAQIVLNDGTQIDIEENSMIVLNIAQNQEASIEFAYGSLQAQSGSGGKGAISIISGDTVLSLNDSDVKLSGGKDQDLNVVVNRGEVELENGGQKQKIEENQVASLSDEGVKVTKLTLRSESPSDGARIFVKDPQTEIPFRVAGTDSARSALLEVSPSRSFSRDTLRREFTGSAASVSLKPGVYYWRASQFDPATGKNETTTVYRFSLLANTPVEPMLPIANAEIRSMADDPFVNFVWRQHDLASGYILEIASDPDFRDIRNRVESQTTSIATKLSQGTYYWRITTRSIIPEGTSTGPVRRLNVSRLRELPPPMLLRPASGQTLPVQLLSGQGIVLQWKGDSESERTEIQISPDPSFSSGGTISRSTQSGYLNLKEEISTGTWYWRARSVASNGTPSPYSGSISFTIASTGQIRILSPLETQKISNLDIRDRGISFNWESASSGSDSRNDFVLSRSRDLSDPVAAREGFQGNNLILDSPGAGTYFWQVRIKDSEGTLLARSDISSFTVLNEIREPVGIFPANDSLVNMAVRDDLPFRWEGSADATGYVFTLYKIENRTRKQLLMKNLTTENYNLTDLSLLDIGEFAWSVKAVMREGNQVLESREVIHYFRISLGDTPAPEIISPEIQYIERPRSSR